jgi:hypothetical protein
MMTPNVLPHAPRCANLSSSMAKSHRRSIHLILGEARQTLEMSQEQFGLAVGSSHRSAVRWDAGQATPAEAHLRTLAGLLHPRDRELAAEVAGHIDETLESLGLETPPPPPPPPAPPSPPPLRAEDLIDVVVLTAVEHTGSAPAVVRPWLHAVFKRGREMGLSMEAAEKALSPAASPDDSEAKGKASKKGSSAK